MPAPRRSGLTDIGEPFCASTLPTFRPRGGRLMVLAGYFDMFYKRTRFQAWLWPWGVGAWEQLGAIECGPALRKLTRESRQASAEAAPPRIGLETHTGCRFPTIIISHKKNNCCYLLFITKKNSYLPLSFTVFLSTIILLNGNLTAVVPHCSTTYASFFRVRVRVFFSLLPLLRTIII